MQKWIPTAIGNYHSSWQERAVSLVSNVKMIQLNHALGQQWHCMTKITLFWVPLALHFRDMVIFFKLMLSPESLQCFEMYLSLKLLTQALTPCQHSSLPLPFFFLFGSGMWDTGIAECRNYSSIPFIVLLAFFLCSSVLCQSGKIQTRGRQFVIISQHH